MLERTIFPRVYLFLLVVVLLIFGSMTLNSFLSPRTSVAQFVTKVRYIPVDAYSEKQINNILHELTFKKGLEITHATSTYILLQK